MNNQNLNQRIEHLEQEVAQLKRLLLSQGIDLLWLPPSRAESIVGQTAESIREAIRDAEEARINRRRHHFKRGTHYRSKGRGKVRPTWEINVELWNKSKDVIERREP